MTISIASNKSAILRLRKGHLMLNDLLYQISILDTHQASRGVKECDNAAGLSAACKVET